MGLQVIAGSVTAIGWPEQPQSFGRENGASASSVSRRLSKGLEICRSLIPHVNDLDAIEIPKPAVLRLIEQRVHVASYHASWGGLHDAAAYDVRAAAAQPIA